VKKNSQGLFLSQSQYARDILTRAHLTALRPITTPISVKPSQVKAADTAFADQTQYRSLVGALQYLTLTRPNLSYAVNIVCQYMHAPTNLHFQMVKRILRYISGTLEMGLQIHRQSTLRLYAFSDSDWAGCPETRCLTKGFCTLLGSNLLSWSTKKQPTVSRSRSEAEYRAMATTAAELTWISFLLQDIGVPQLQPATLFCDNINALHMTINPVFHAQSKHIELDCQFITEKLALGQIVTKFVPSHRQVADIFTKPLSRDVFTTLRGKLSL
ncbi:hypothetical protein CFOL_v3_00329, partial [Cephalotus follicularis]